MENNARREFSSLRDPSGFVFYLEGGVYRALDDESFATLKALSDRGLLDRLVREKKVVPTDLNVASNANIRSVTAAHPRFPHVVAHEPIPTLTTPAEWTRSMLCDAALLELELQMSLVDDGFMLKDATAYNVQFVGTEPIHIDLPSIERRGGGVWPAYGQFCRMFLFPLLLHRYRRMSLKSYFLTHLNGMDLDEAATSMDLLDRLRPASLMDVFLPQLMQRLVRKKTAGSLRQMVEASTAPPEALKANLARLIRLVRSLRKAPRHAGSRWDRYTEENLYSASERNAKKEAVRRLLKRAAPRTVLDLGSNTGEYAFVAAETAERVLAVEGDHESLDRLYVTAKERKAAIQPIWTDLLNPTPATGFRNRERKAFEDRVRGDTVMALALVHHLIATSNFPLGEVADLLFGLAGEHLLVEYVSPKDPQFESLIGLRLDASIDLTEAMFAETFGKRGRCLESVRLNDFRTLFLFAKN